MSPSEDYFVKYWDSNPAADGNVQLFCFSNDEKLFEWIQSHKGEKFSVHKAAILLDFS
jgi:hypothetical protein